MTAPRLSMAAWRTWGRGQLQLPRGACQVAGPPPGGGKGVTSQSPSARHRPSPNHCGLAPAPQLRERAWPGPHAPPRPRGRHSRRSRRGTRRDSGRAAWRDRSRARQRRRQQRRARSAGRAPPQAPPRCREAATAGCRQERARRTRRRHSSLCCGTPRLS